MQFPLPRWDAKPKVDLSLEEQRPGGLASQPSSAALLPVNSQPRVNVPQLSRRCSPHILDSPRILQDALRATDNGPLTNDRARQRGSQFLVGTSGTFSSNVSSQRFHFSQPFQTME